MRPHVIGINECSGVITYYLSYIRSVLNYGFRSMESRAGGLLLLLWRMVIGSRFILCFAYSSDSSLLSVKITGLKAYISRKERKEIIQDEMVIWRCNANPIDHGTQTPGSYIKYENVLATFTFCILWKMKLKKYWCFPDHFVELPPSRVLLKSAQPCWSPSLKSTLPSSTRSVT